MICVFVNRGRDEVLQACNHEEEISESTSRIWLEINVSMFDSLKLGFRRTKQQTDFVYISTSSRSCKHATKGGQRLQAGEGQEETKRQSQLRCLLLGCR